MPGPLKDPDDIRRYSNALRIQSERRIEALTKRLADGQIDLATWQAEMKAELRRANHEQFVIGKGGIRDEIRRTDYLQLGPELKRQYRFLARFADQLAKSAQDGKDLTYAVERAKLYARSTQAMMWKSALPVKLPQVPRDGKTKCRTNCKCRLSYEYERNDTGAITAVLVFWKLRPAEHCDDCRALAREWNPRRFEITTESAAGIDQCVELVLMDSVALTEGERATVRAMWEVQPYAFSSH